jgi:hypothetical protein
MFSDPEMKVNMMLEGPWKTYESHNVHDQCEAVKLLYDVDTEHANKKTAYMVYEHMLLPLNEMQETLVICAEKMKKMLAVKPDDGSWISIAQIDRKHKRSRLQTQIDTCTSKCSSAIADYTSMFPGVYQGFDQPEEDAKHDFSDEARAPRRGIRQLQQMVDDAAKELRQLEIREQDGSFTDKEQKEARDSWDARNRVVPGCDVKQEWTSILKLLLRTVLHTPHDPEAETQLKATCRDRMDACVKTGITELRMAEALYVEQRVLMWGRNLYTTLEEQRRTIANDAGYKAWTVFYSNTTTLMQWGHLAARDATDSAEVMLMVIKQLRQQGRTMIVGSANRGDLSVAIVAPVKAKKVQMKMRRAVTRKGNYLETTEEQEPGDELEDEEPVAPRKRLPPADRDETDLPAPKAVAAIARPQASGYDARRATSDMEQTVRSLAAQVDKLQAQAAKTRGPEVQLPLENPFERKRQWEDRRGGFRGRGRQNYQRRDDYDRRHDNDNRGSFGNGRDYDDGYGRNRSRSRDNGYDRREGPSNDRWNNPGDRGITAAGGSRGSDQVRPAAAVAAAEPCHFRPCYSTACPKTHEQGQHTPDPNFFKVVDKFRRANKCKWDHDSRDCSGKPKCTKTHGVCAETGPRCDLAGQDMCSDFYTPAGCAKTHKRN